MKKAGQPAGRSNTFLAPLSQPNLRISSASHIRVISTACRSGDASRNEGIGGKRLGLSTNSSWVTHFDADLHAFLVFRYPFVTGCVVPVTAFVGHIFRCE